MRLDVPVLLRMLHLKHERAAGFGSLAAKRFVVGCRVSDWRQIGEWRIEIHER